MPRSHFKVDWLVAGPLVRAWLLAAAPQRRERRGLRQECFAALADEIPGLTADRLNCWLDDASGRSIWREAVAAIGKPPGTVTAAPAPVPALPPLASDHPQLRVLERRVATLTDELAAERRKRKEADRERTLYDDLADVIRTETQPLELARCAMPEPKAGQYPVDGVALLADEHADEVIHGVGTWGLERYDFNVFRVRLARWAEVIRAHLTVHLPKHHFERLWVFKLGDALNGPIHDHEYRNHFGNSIRAALAVGDAEAQAIAWLAEVLPVHVVSVPGNHPRTTQRKDYDDPHANFDFLVASQMATRLQGFVDAGRVTVLAPRSWSAYVEVRGRVWALNHGDDVKGTWGIPWYGYNRKHNRVQALLARHDARVSYFVHGHYHTDVGAQEGDARSIHAGAFTVTDPYAAEKIAGGSEPTQQMFVVNEKRGRLLEIPIQVRDPEDEDAFRAGTYEPPFGRSSVLDVVGEADGLAERGAFPLIRAETAA